MRRRRNRTLLLLILLILVLMGAALLLVPRFAAGPAPTPTPTPPSLKPIVIAAQSIPRGAVITESDVTLRGWPVEVLPEGAFADPKEVIGKVARVDIPRQKPIVPEDLTVQPSEAARRGSEASLFVPPGKVAFPIPADEAGAVAFNLAPGDRVDVVATFRLAPVKATADGEFRPQILDEDLFNRLRALGVEPGAAAQAAVVRPGAAGGITGQPAGPSERGDPFHRALRAAAASARADAGAGARRRAPRPRPPRRRASDTSRCSSIRRRR
jgi:pilus assembly protein CpaB